MKSSISFILGEETIELSDFEPDMMVSQWLRERFGRTGTKIGCGEGDCGACTVLIGFIRDGELRYETVNSCIRFLVTLDGTHLITVEDLKRDDGTLHPVQQAMVDCHGSQCGFCTPGFVMSLLGYWRDQKRYDCGEVRDYLAGNLCRCTGYGPILKAGERSLTLDDGIEKPFGALVQQKLQDMNSISAVCIEHEGRSFFLPKNLEETLELKSQYPQAVIVSGATDVGLWITKEDRRVDQFIGLHHVHELRFIKDLGNDIEIGAALSYRDGWAEIGGLYEDAGELIRRIGAVQVRNSGTFGGNVVNGSPVGDTLPFLLAIDARLKLIKKGGVRELALEDYFGAEGQKNIEADEVLYSIIIPKPDPNYLFRCYKVSKRTDQDIATICAAFYFKVEDMVIQDMRMAFGGMAAAPKRARQTENAITGALWSRIELEIALSMLAKDFEPITDLRGSSQYRIELARQLLRKCHHESSKQERIRMVGTGAVRYG